MHAVKKFPSFSVCLAFPLFYIMFQMSAVIITCYVFCLFRFKAVASKSKLDLVNEGFTEFTIEDFHNTVSFLHKKKKTTFIVYELTNLNEDITKVGHGM